MAQMKIKDWAEDDRPREKLLQKGAQALSNAELIAILIASGNKNETAVDIAKKLLAQTNNNINDLGRKNVQDFTQIKGIGTAKAVCIAAALELGRRRQSAKSDIVKISCSRDIFEIFQPLLSDLTHEEFWILALNQSNGIICKQKISQGGIAATLVDIRLAAKIAVENLASFVAVVHNHPSQNTQPSNEDKNLTTQLQKAFAVFDIKLIDHIIIASNDYLSFADENLM